MKTLKSKEVLRYEKVVILFIGGDYAAVAYDIYGSSGGDADND